MSFKQAGLPNTRDKIGVPVGNSHVGKKTQKRPPVSMVFQGDQFRRALDYVGYLHANQERKGAGERGIPYMTHLLSVAALVGEMDGSEDEVLAALLHDTLEDHPREGKTESEIIAMFGWDVFDIVVGCTNTYDDKLLPMNMTKPLYVAHLRSQPPSVHRVALADKLHNLRCTVLNLRCDGGEAVWARFRGGKNDTLSYYRLLSEMFEEVLPGEFTTEFTATVYLAHSLASLKVAK